MEYSPFFSVVVPVYNKGPHVARAIKSVLNQSLKNFELILINDASSDNSLGEMQKFQDPRIRILHREKPGPGAGPARNLGIREANAEWVAFLDADDAWYPHHLEKMWALISKNPEIKFFSCGWETRENSSMWLDQYFQNFVSRGQRQITCHEYLSFDLKGYRPVCTSVAVVNKKICFASTLFPEEREAKRGEDLHAWLKLICILKVMAWSPHVGGIYYRNNVNMLTKSAPYTSHLMSKKAYEELSVYLGKTEKKLLAKLFNKYLLHAWKANLVRKRKNFSLVFKLFWFEDVLFSCKWAVLSFVPAEILRFVLNIRVAFFNFCNGKSFANSLVSSEEEIEKKSSEYSGPRK